MFSRPGAVRVGTFAGVGAVDGGGEVVVVDAEPEPPPLQAVSRIRPARRRTGGSLMAPIIAERVAAERAPLAGFGASGRRLRRR